MRECRDYGHIRKLHRDDVAEDADRQLVKMYSNLLITGDVIEAQIGKSVAWRTIWIESVEQDHVNVKQQCGNGWSNHRYHKGLIKKCRLPKQN